MSKSRRLAQLQQLHRLNRPGEGTAIGGDRKQVANADGTTGTLFTLNLNTAPVPDRRYVADIASVSASEHRLSLIFGQSKVVGTGTRSLLVIEVATTFAAQIVNMIQELIENLRKYVKQHDVPALQLVDIKEEPSQTVSLAGNVVAAGYASRDACLDFYYVSPFAIQQAEAGGDFVAEPVVRVSLPTSLLLSICERLDEMKATFPSEHFKAIK